MRFSALIRDSATIWLHAGKGGDGAVSFHREKYVAAGGPDGGDGGRGGDIIFVADDHLSNLMDFRYKRKYVAPEGGKGGASLCNGKNAENLVIKVPLGTVIKDAESGLVIADLSDHTPVRPTSAISFSSKVTCRSSPGIPGFANLGIWRVGVAKCALP